jgi:hypothetical protein
MVYSPVALTPQTPARNGGKRQGDSGRRCPLSSVSQTSTPPCTCVCLRFQAKLKVLQGPQQRSPGTDVPGKLGQGRPERAGCLGTAGYCHTGAVAPAWGCVRPGQPTELGRVVGVAWGDLGEGERIARLGGLAGRPASVRAPMKMSRAGSAGWTRTAGGRRQRQDHAPAAV